MTENVNIEEELNADDTENVENDSVDNGAETEVEEVEPEAAGQVEESVDPYQDMSVDDLRETLAKRDGDIRGKAGKIAADKKVLANQKLKIDSYLQNESADPNSAVFKAMEGAKTNEERKNIEHYIAFNAQLHYLDTNGRDKYDDWNEVMERACEGNPKIMENLAKLNNIDKIYKVASNPEKLQSVFDPLKGVFNSILQEGDDKKVAETPERVMVKKVANAPLKKLRSSGSSVQKLSEADRINNIKKKRYM